MTRPNLDELEKLLVEAGLSVPISTAQVDDFYWPIREAPDEDGDRHEFCSVQYGTQAHLIVAAVNALPELIAWVRELELVVATSKEVAVISELVAENDRLRLAISQAIARMTASPATKVSNGFCSWCEEAWLHLDGSSVEDIRQHAREHAYRCKKHPMKLERDAALARVAELEADE